MSHTMRAALLFTLAASCAAKKGLNDWLGLEQLGASVGPASSGVSSTTIGGGILADGERVWGDLSTSRFVEVPAWMKGVQLAKPGYRVPPMKLFWDCPKFDAGNVPPMNPNGCMCYIFQYKCGGCHHEEGGLGKLLEQQTRSWEKFYCAPKFKIEDSDPLTDNEARHPMIAYRTWANSGERVEVDLTAPVTEFVVIGGDFREQVRTCSKYDSSNCEDKLGQCEWDAANDECINRTCRKPYTGPTFGNGLGVCAARCVHDDLP